MMNYQSQFLGHLGVWAQFEEAALAVHLPLLAHDVELEVVHEVGVRVHGGAWAHEGRLDGGGLDENQGLAKYNVNV